jgi:predicted dinucleotide-binding enzyme
MIAVTKREQPLMWHHRVILLLLALSPLGASPGWAESPGTVAIIGTGDMGDSLGPRLAGLGYTVVYGSRDPEAGRIAELVAKTGDGASAALPADATAKADIIVLAVPWPAMEQVAQSLGDLDGKILIDISMPFTQGEDGYPEHMFKTSSAEMIRDWNPGARVVKTFGTMGSGLIDDPDAAGGIVSIPVASDDREAKEVVARIIAGMQLDPVDFGPLRMARQIENLQMIYMIPLVQNRPQNWEFHFRRGTQFGCYLADASTAEAVTPVYDAKDLARFPAVGHEPAPACP